MVRVAATDAGAGSAVGGPNVIGAGLQRQSGDGSARTWPPEECTALAHVDILHERMHGGNSRPRITSVMKGKAPRDH